MSKLLTQNIFKTVFLCFTKYNICLLLLQTYIFYDTVYILYSSIYFLILKYTALDLKIMYKNNLVGCAVSELCCKRVCVLHCTRGAESDQ